MTLTDSEKKHYINNNFHQYFDLELNTNLEDITGAVNLVVPMETLTNEQTITTNFSHHKTFNGFYKPILEKYQNSPYANEENYERINVFESTNDYIEISSESSVSKKFNFNYKKGLRLSFKTKNSSRIKVYIEKIDSHNNVVDKLPMIEEVINNSQVWETRSVSIPPEARFYDYNQENEEEKYTFDLKIANLDKTNSLYISNLYFIKYNSQTENLLLTDLQQTTEYIPIESELRFWNRSGTIRVQKFANKIITAKCINVVDGDTIDVKIPYKMSVDANTEEETLKYVQERIRLVGINAPEQGFDGYEVSKFFLERVCGSRTVSEKVPEGEKEQTHEECCNKEVLLKIDSKKQRDKYGRLLAVLIVDNKNINEVLLKEGFAEIDYIPPSEFNPYDWVQGINVPVKKYQFHNDSIIMLSPYFNEDFTNIVFTPQNQTSVLYDFQVYKNVIYIKLNPFSQQIRMHILPKHYDCSKNDILFFKDEMITLDDIDLTDDYYHYEHKDPINAYYQINGENRIVPRPTESEDYQYDINDWTNTMCYFSHDISNETKNMTKVQICAGYRYNKTNPLYSIHYTGIKDNTSTRIEDRCTLVDANYDNINTDTIPNVKDKTNTNYITQFNYRNNNIYIPKNQRIIRDVYGKIDHVTEIGTLNHKIIKYIDDLMYAEENYYDENGIQKIYGLAEWVDLSEPQH